MGWWTSQFNGTSVAVGVAAVAGIALWNSEWVWEAINRKVEQADMRIKRKRRPMRIFVIRHGQSQGNVDPKIYESVPDNQIALTELGRNQADGAGARLKEEIGDESILFYVSPFLRSVQTYEEIVKHFDPDQYRTRQDPRIREQEFANYQDVEQMLKYKAERIQVGRFYYRFPEGESGADVFDRVSSFLESLFREFAKDPPPQNVVVVTHGLTARLFLMRYYRWSVKEFEAIWNFENCEYACLKLQPEYGTYELVTKLRTDAPTTPKRRRLPSQFEFESISHSRRRSLDEGRKSSFVRSCSSVMEDMEKVEEKPKSRGAKYHSTPQSKGTPIPMGHEDSMT